jgi:hypothetical protein
VPNTPLKQNVKRGANGHWEKGESGNLNGRPKAIERPAELSALDVLYKVATDKKGDPFARVSAASAILDRGWGKPPQTIIIKRGSDG